jgi:hypothetical protein
LSTSPDTKKWFENLQWVHVALIFILCSTVFALVTWGGQDLQMISTFIIAIAGVGGYVALRQVKQDQQEVKVLANGNLARKDLEIALLQKQLQDAQRLHTQEVAQMAVQVPSSASLPQSLYADEHANGAGATSTTLQLPVVTT